MKTVVNLLAAILILGGGNYAQASSAPKDAAQNASGAQKYNQSKTKSTNVATSGNLSPEKQYQILVQRKTFLEQDIILIRESLPGLSKSQSKKAVKRVEALQLELSSVATSMSMFSKSITQKGYIDNQSKVQKEAFMKSLALKTAKLIEANDPFSGQISVDKELEQSYRQYINEGREVSLGKDDFSTESNSGQINALVKQQGRFYSVLFAIASQPISVKKFPYNKIYTQKLKNGLTGYFAGAFAQESDAQRVCGQILSKGQYRDSFVVLIK